MGTAIAVGSALIGAYSRNNALIAQGRANQMQALNYIKSMNYNFQSLEQERRDAFEATVEDLEKTQLQGNRMESSVSAAVNEGLEGGGRTADLLKRGSEADTARALISIKDNYRKKSNEIDLNKESVLMNTEGQMKSIQNVEKPSLLGTVFGLATGYLQGRMTEETLKAMRNHAGVGKDYTKSTSNFKMKSYYSTYNTDWLGIGKNDKFNFSIDPVGTVGYKPYDRTSVLNAIF